MPPNISRVPPPLRITEAARAPVRYEHPYGNPFYDYSRLSSRESPGRGGLTPSSPQLREPRRCRDGRGCRPWLLSIPADSGRHRSNSVKTREKRSLSAGTARGCQRLITAALLVVVEQHVASSALQLLAVCRHRILSHVSLPRIRLRNYLSLRIRGETPGRSSRLA